MRLIKNIPVKKQAISISATDLFMNTNSEASQTVPASDMVPNIYNQGASAYLEMLGVNKIKEQYNEEVERFESELEEQEFIAKAQTNVATDIMSDRAVEAQANLGTGASAVAAQGRQAALRDVHASIEQNIEETYTSGMQELNESYRTRLESILGEYDTVTGTFEGLSQYEQMSNSTTEATAKVLARIINPQTDDWLKTLVDAGYIESIGGGEWAFTDVGLEQLDAMVNSIFANNDQDALGGNTFMYAIATEMAKTNYILQHGEAQWESLSEEKRDELITEYNSWLYNNQDSLRVTAWGLYSQTDEGYVIDKSWNTPALNGAAEGITDNGTYILDFDNAATKQKIISGEIPDDSYFTLEDSELDDDSKYYYVKNNVIYSTQYTASNPPRTISLESATVRSFGKFLDTGSGRGKQDSWVNAVISAAKAGKIPDGTYISMNYGAISSNAEKRSYYQYYDGAFHLVEGKFVSMSGMGSHAYLQVGNKQISYDSVIVGSEFLFFDTSTSATDKYLNW